MRVRPLFCSAAQIAREMKRAHQIAMSKSTVRRDLIECGYVPRVRRYVPTTVIKDHTARLEFARTYRHKFPTGSIVFTDEKIFSCNDCGHRSMWVPRGSYALSRENTRWPTRLMLWGAIGRDFFHWVILKNNKKKKNPDEDEEKKHRTLNCMMYKNRILPTTVKHCQDHNRVLMQDGAGPHKAKVVYKYLKNKGVTVIDWPPRSPDLNPIETLWALIEVAVSNRFPQTYAELAAAVEEVFTDWRDNKMWLINKLVNSFDDRCATVIAKEGRM